MSASTFLLCMGVGLAVLFQGIHQVDEGYVAVYYRGGRLLSETAEAGLHFSIPFLTQYRSVQTTLQTDEVRNVPCGTSGGVTITFERIEVVNQLSKDKLHETIKQFGVNYDNTLIFKKIHHELNQFCSKHTLQEVYIDYFDRIDEDLKATLQLDANKMAPGLHIQAVRVSKPKIPNRLKDNYEKIEAEKTELMINLQKQKNEERKAETEKKVAVIEAQKIKDVAAIKHSQQIAEKEAQLKMSKIEDEQFSAKEKAKADSTYYTNLKEAEANKLRLTPGYLEMLKIEKLSQNTKLFFGPSIPSYFSNNIDALTNSKTSK